MERERYPFMDIWIFETIYGGPKCPRCPSSSRLATYFHPTCPWFAWTTKGNIRKIIPVVVRFSLELLFAYLQVGLHGKTRAYQL